MANRYWVGGTGTWNTTNTVNWSATSGGAGGASVPTSADDTFFDANSGGGTVTIGAAVSCKSLDFTGFSGTLTGASNISVYGNLVLSSTMTTTGYTGVWYLSAASGSYTATTNGKTLAAMQIGVLGSTATFSLMDALTLTGWLSVTSGTFNTNGYAITATQLVSVNSNTRTINLGSSTLTLSGTTPVDFTTTIGLTLNAGTSTINLTYLMGTTIQGGNQTFYNVNYPQTNSASASLIYGNNTFNNLSFIAPSVAAQIFIRLYGNQTINGQLSVSNTAGNRRVVFQTDALGIQRNLTINGTTNLTDVDFQDIIVNGTAAPISGTRIGDRRGCSGINFSTPKNVYWVGGTGNWSNNKWASTSNGTASTDNFPLPQDTAIIDNNSGAAASTITLDAQLPHIGTIDMTARTNALTLGGSTAYNIYGDWKSGSGVTNSYGGVLNFLGRNTQTILSNGKSFGAGITVNSFGGTVQLGDAFISSITLTITNGTFDTKGYALSLSIISSSNSNVRTIKLNNSLVTMSAAITLTTYTNLTFDTGTSTINLSSTSSSHSFINQTFYNVNLTNTSGYQTFSGSGNTFNNLTVTAPATADLTTLNLGGDQTINGSLTIQGASPTRRVYIKSNTPGTQRTLTVNNLVASDVDFRDIKIAGNAANQSITRAGDCGGNGNIIFPTPKTIYWNLAGSNDISETGWSLTSGGTPNINNFPLAQDTAIIDDNNSATTIQTSAHNFGSFDLSQRSNPLNINLQACNIYGDFKLSSSIGIGASSTLTFAGRKVQNVLTAGKSLVSPIIIDNFNGTVLLNDALTTTASSGITLTSGTFDANDFNVTATAFSCIGAYLSTLKMKSGLWTLTGSGACWTISSITNLTFLKGSANILLSDNSTAARTFTSAGLITYNKLTIGGNTSNSTTTITGGGNQFTEIASTKTVAHTIALGTTTQTVGKWSVTGTAGNVVSLTGTGTIIVSGSRVENVDYLALGTVNLSTISPGEFYAGANSTGTGTGFIKTAAPAARTVYWVGGTGTWDAASTTHWSLTSGGAAGALPPTSVDTVIFDSNSSTAAYTVTCTATQLYCGTLRMGAPATGKITWAGSAPIAIHQALDLVGGTAGITRTHTGSIYFTGTGLGKTINTNGISLAGSLYINGVLSEWNLVSGLTSTNGITHLNGSFATNNYELSILVYTSSNIYNDTAINFGSSLITGEPTIYNIGNCNFNPVSSTINTGNIYAYGIALNNVNLTSTMVTSFYIGSSLGPLTINNLSITALTSKGLKQLNFANDLTITETLTITAPTDATSRVFLASDTMGVQRTLNVNAISSLQDVDFRDIKLAGNAVAGGNVSGTRLGDCKGNSGITFDAPKTVYWNLAGSNNITGLGWSLTSGGTPNINNFPLAQDTAFIDNNIAITSVSIPSTYYNLGTIDLSNRTNTLTFFNSATSVSLYGDLKFGNGVIPSGAGTYIFSGRNTQYITCAGKTLPNPVTIDSPNGTVKLNDAFSNSATSNLTLTRGGFDANGYNVSVGTFVSANTNTRTLKMGSGSWTLNANTGSVFNTTENNLTFDAETSNIIVTGTGSISFNPVPFDSARPMQFNKLTISAGSAISMLTMGYNTKFNEIISTRTVPYTISLGSSIKYIKKFTVSGSANNLVTITGTSASSPSTLIFTGTEKPNVNYLNLTNVRGYDLVDTWYVGSNSVNNGSLGFNFKAMPVVAPKSSSAFLLFF